MSKKLAIIVGLISVVFAFNAQAIISLTADGTLSFDGTKFTIGGVSDTAPVIENITNDNNGTGIGGSSVTITSGSDVTITSPANYLTFNVNSSSNNVFANNDINFVNNKSITINALGYGGFIQNFSPNSPYSIGNTIINNGTISINSLNSSDIAILNSSFLSSITNNGTINGGIFNQGDLGDIVPHIVAINNSGTIINSGGDAIYNQAGSMIGAIINSGTISSTGGYGINNQSEVTAISNSGGHISSINNGSFGYITNGGYAAIYNSSSGTSAGIIDLINNAGSIGSSNSDAIYNGSGSVIGSINNSYYINSDANYYAINNAGTINSIINSGVISSINNSGYIINNNGDAIYNEGYIGTITNSGTISSTNGYAINNQNQIDSITNNVHGDIEGGILAGTSWPASDAVINNYGTINNSNGNAIYYGSQTGNGSVYNYGIITATNGSGIDNSDQLYSITNSGSGAKISSINNETTGGLGSERSANSAISNAPNASGGEIGFIDNNGYIYSSIDAISNGLGGIIDTINNAYTGLISSSSGYGINNAGTITTLTNYGAISSGSGLANIYNTGTITTLNNGQGGVDSNGGTGQEKSPLTYTGNLPGNYNIVINSSTSYGQLSALSAVSGTMNFGLAARSVDVGLYADVLQGISSSHIGTSSGIYSNTNSSYNGYTWYLEREVGNPTNWDLAFSQLGINIINYATNFGNVSYQNDTQAVIDNSNSNYPNNTIASITNNSTISGNGITPAGIAQDAIYNDSGSTIGTITNNERATISAEYGFGIDNVGTINSIINNGDIEGGIGNQSLSLANGAPAAAINSITNNGIIHNNNGPGIDNDYNWLIENLSSIGAITNNGTISSTNRSGIANWGTITSISNYGSITSGSGIGFADISNSGSIGILNNAQGGNNNALTYTGSLPGTYNIVINSPTSYGQLLASGASGHMNFGIAAGSSVNAVLYADVLQGIGASYIGSMSGLYSGDSWSLVLDANNLGANDWNLVFSGAINIVNTGSNSGTINSIPTAYLTTNSNLAIIDNSHQNYANNVINSITNNLGGTISGAGSGEDAIYNANGSTIGTITNNGTITGDTNNYGINNFGAINSIVNSGSISSINNLGTIINNNGYDIDNTRGTIGTLNNGQGGGGINTPLTYTGNLPGTYNILVSSSASYGQLLATNISGKMNVGVLNGSSITQNSYADVLQGIGASNLGNNNGTYTPTSGGSTQNWYLVRDTNSVIANNDWNLVFAPSTGTTFINNNHTTPPYTYPGNIGSTTAVIYNAGGNYNPENVLTYVNNSGSVIASAKNQDAIYNADGSAIGAVSNTETISATNGGDGIYNAGTMVSISNSGTGGYISSIYNATTGDIINSSGAAISNSSAANPGVGSITNAGIIESTNAGSGSKDAIDNSGTMTSITNLGTGIISSVAGYGINNTGGTVGTITNLGSISSGTGLADINNTGGGTIGTLNNGQGGGTNAPLTYTGALPGTYNIIISSSTSYGQLEAVNGVSGKMNFGIYSTSINPTPGSSYLNVLENISATHLYATSGLYNGETWSLVTTDGIDWTLKFSGGFSIYNSVTMAPGNNGAAIIYNGGGSSSPSNIIDAINNSGSIIASGNNQDGIYNALGSVIGTISNTGTISATNGGYGIDNHGAITSVSNSGAGYISSIYNAKTGTIINGSGDAISNSSSANPGIGSITNAGLISATGSGASAGDAIDNSGQITSITNLSTGIIESSNGSAIYNASSAGSPANTIGSITNAGLITALGNTQDAIFNGRNSVIGSISNTGTISVALNSTGYGIDNQGQINSGINNSGVGYISSVNNTAIGTIANNSGDAIINTSTANPGIGAITNAGSITATGAGSAAGDAIDNSGIITSVTNTGTISSTAEYGIRNTGTIATISNNSGSISSGTGLADINNTGGTIGTLNNGQGGQSVGVNNSPLTYSGKLPGTYNIDINSSTHYGQLSALGAISGTMNFGTAATSLSIAPASSYTNVLEGIGAINLGNNSGTYTFGGSTQNWYLINNGSTKYWNLVFAPTPNANNPTIITSITNPQGTTYSYSGSGGSSTAVIYNAGATYNPENILNSITNGGNITASGANQDAIYNGFNGGLGSAIGSINNTGTISATNGGYGIDNSGSITSVSNSATGNISSINNSTTGNIINGSGDAIENSGIIGPVTNAGVITSSAVGSYGINNQGTIASISNSGVSGPGYISSINNAGTITAGINNAGTIGTLNNGQGQMLNAQGKISGASTPLTYSGNLPGNYNIIITPTSYGQLLASNIPTSGVGSQMNFGIATGSSAAPGSYTDVLQGINSANIVAKSGTSNGENWRLISDNGSTTNWNLVVSPSLTNILNNLIPQLQNNFLKQISMTNFANMNTYDCNLFDTNGACISIGGQRNNLSNPSSASVAEVLVLGYKVSSHIRLGAFFNETGANDVAAGVRISDKTPLMGVFGVWNQNSDTLGLQIKLANTYQNQYLDTMRGQVGTTQVGSGETNLNTQSYVGEVSYAVKDYDLTSRPYLALRSTTIKQNAYKENSASIATPLSYQALENQSLTVLAGSKFDYQLTDKLNLTASLGIEQDLFNDAGTIVASDGNGIVSENLNNKVKHLRAVGGFGAYYAITPTQRIAGEAFFQQLPSHGTSVSNIYINYTVGF